MVQAPDELKTFNLGTDSPERRVPGLIGGGAVPLYQTHPEQMVQAQGELSILELCTERP